MIEPHIIILILGLILSAAVIVMAFYDPLSLNFAIAIHEISVLPKIDPDRFESETLLPRELFYPYAPDEPFNPNGLPWYP